MHSQLAGLVSGGTDVAARAKAEQSLITQANTSTDVAARAKGQQSSAEEGSEVVSNLLVGMLVVAVVLGLMQLAFTVHVRNTLTDAAGEGARLAALSESSAAEGRQRTRELVSTALSPRFAQKVEVTELAAEPKLGPDFAGASLIQVRVEAPVPILGFFSFGATQEVVGHALAEEKRP